MIVKSYVDDPDRIQAWFADYLQHWPLPTTYMTSAGDASGRTVGLDKLRNLVVFSWNETRIEQRFQILEDDNRTGLWPRRAATLDQTPDATYRALHRLLFDYTEDEVTIVTHLGIHDVLPMLEMEFLRRGLLTPLTANTTLDLGVLVKAAKQGLHREPGESYDDFQFRVVHNREPQCVCDLPGGCVELFGLTPPTWKPDASWQCKAMYKLIDRLRTYEQAAPEDSADGCSARL